MKVGSKLNGAKGTPATLSANSICEQFPSNFFSVHLRYAELCIITIQLVNRQLFHCLAEAYSNEQNSNNVVKQRLHFSERALYEGCYFSIDALPY